MVWVTTSKKHGWSTRPYAISSSGLASRYQVSITGQHLALNFDWFDHFFVAGLQFILERAEYPVPDREEATIVLVQTIPWRRSQTIPHITLARPRFQSQNLTLKPVGAMVDSVMWGKVENKTKGTQIANLGWINTRAEYGRKGKGIRVEQCEHGGKGSGALTSSVWIQNW